MYKSYFQYIEDLKGKEKYRNLQSDFNKSFIDFSSNDYLGLSKSSVVLEAAKLAGTDFGVGSTGSRLLSGNRPIFEKLEKKIAQDKKTQSSIIFNSGFQANITVLSSLLDEKVLGHKPIVFFDKYNHASLYQAVFLSNAELIRYHHNDMNHLCKLLLKFKHERRKKFIVSETLFGMDGDVLPIDKIFTLAKEHDAFLYLDEAHATGIIGDDGYGLSTRINLNQVGHLVLGTFSKALGCFGGYVCCSNIIKDYLINKCAGFIYSTALPPIIIGSANKAWDIVRNLGNQRKNLILKAQNLRDSLQKLGLNIGNSTTHIMPIILGNEGCVINAKNKLLKEGLILSAIRPPTVPPNTARLRIALNVNHSQSNLDYLVAMLKTI